MQFNKANNSDTEAPFLDLHLSISNGFVSSKLYNKRDDFDFDKVNFSNIDGDVPRSFFWSIYIYIYEKCIPKTSTYPKKCNLWYNDDCKEAVKQRKENLSRFCKFPTKDKSNHQNVTWGSYVSSLNYKT